MNPADEGISAILDECRRLDMENRRKSNFLSTMSHELRTPLNAILGFSELMRDDLLPPLDPSRELYLKNIEESASYLLALITDLLDISRISNGTMTIEVGPQDVGAIVDHAVRLLHADILKNDLRVDNRVETGRHLVNGDKYRLVQAVTNLLSNATRYAYHEIVIEVHESAPDLPAGRLRLAVIDDGPGVPEQVGERIFDPYFVAESRRDAATGGLGLGLPLARSIAELHGGRLSFARRSEGGTAFLLDLPRWTDRQNWADQ